MLQLQGSTRIVVSFEVNNWRWNEGASLLTVSSFHAPIFLSASRLSPLYPITHSRQCFQSSSPSSFLSHFPFLRSSFSCWSTFSNYQQASGGWAVSVWLKYLCLFKCVCVVLMYVCPYKHPHLPPLYHHWNWCATMGKINFSLRESPLQPAFYLPTCPVTASIFATCTHKKTHSFCLSTNLSVFCSGLHHICP